ncbi:MAG: hypothetical protein ACLFTH_04915 [Candidatus Woesearchaeota archaeon]
MVVSLLLMLERLARKALKNHDEGLLKEIQEGFRRKFSSVDAKTWNKLQSYYPVGLDSLEYLLEHESFLFGRMIEVKYRLNANSEDKDLWCVRDGEAIPIEVLREGTRLVFENPYTDTVESWSKPVHLTRRYGKHLPWSRNADASKYLSTVDHKHVEETVLEQGKGYVDSAKKLFLYGRFASKVGRLPGGDETSLVKLDVVRIKKGYGTYMHVHGYPVAEAEVRRDCPRGLYERIMGARIDSA